MSQAMPAVAGPLLAAAWLSGCSSAPATNNMTTAAAPLPKSPETPIEAAHRLVLARLNVRDGVGFADDQVYASAGATIVCGRYARSDRAPLRYIVVGDEDVFVEGDYQGDIGRAVAETCTSSASEGGPTAARAMVGDNPEPRGRR